MKFLKSLAMGCLFVSSLCAADFSSMSTEELMNMRGTVPFEDRPAFREEMQKRMQSLTPEERQKYNVGRGIGGQQKGMGQGGGMGKGNGKGNK